MSPLLFNLFIADCPVSTPIQPSFADDLYFCDSDSDVGLLGPRLSQALVPVSEWARANKLVLAPSKSAVTLFTPDTHQSSFHPQVTLDGSVLKLDRAPRFLGVIWDTHFTFSQHIEHLRAKASQRLAVLKAVAGAEWGSDLSTLLNTFRLYVRSSYSYAAGIWGPVVKPGLIERRLQPIQNAALRIVTGCHRMASSDHVHHETKTLTVLDHTNLLCAQFLASCLRPTHPSFHTVTLPPGTRSMKPTLLGRFSNILSPYLVDNKMPCDAYNLAKNSIHTSAVQSAIDGRAISQVLGVKPPNVSHSISRLPRQTQRSLSQLRSGHSTSLASYRHKLNNDVSNLCPDCLTTPQTTRHLFECTSNPTSLSVEDLWINPIAASTFLSTTSSFSSLALPAPPSPPPPPPPPLLLPIPRPPPDPPPSFSPVSSISSFGSSFSPASPLSPASSLFSPLPHDFPSLGLPRSPAVLDAIGSANVGNSTFHDV